MIEIKSRCTGDVILRDDEAETIRDAVVKAVANRTNLRGANLSGADLREANLSRANLPSPTVVLLATWGDLSQQLCADLMLFDARNHPDPTAFDRWANGSGECPYDGVHVSRAANFTENKEYWGQGQPCRPYDLMVRVLAEKCPDWSDERVAEFMKAFERKES